MKIGADFDGAGRSSELGLLLQDLLKQRICQLFLQLIYQLIQQLIQQLASGHADGDVANASPLKRISTLFKIAALVKQRPD